MGELKPSDIAWLRDQKEGGHCGEGTFERQGRARHNDMVDRLLAAVEARTEGRGDEPVASDKALFDALWELVAAMANEGIPKTPRTKAAFKVAHQAALDRLRKDWSSPIREPEISRTILGDPCTLEACPPGLFIADAYNTLGMKSEYRTEQGAIEAYIVESGEFFWGDNPQTVERQRAQIVRPISYADAILNLAPVAKGASQDAELSDEFDRPGRLSDATRHSAEGAADPALSGARGVVAPVGGRGEEGSSQSQPVLSPKSDTEGPSADGSVRRPPYVFHSLSACAGCGCSGDYFPAPDAKAYEVTGELYCDECAEEAIALAQGAL